jgi:hypothetical protein
MDVVDFLKSYADLSDKLITLAIALLTLSITFIDKLRANLKTKKQYNMLILLWFLLIVSVFLGLVSSYAGVNTALACADTDENTKCQTSWVMEYSLLANLIVFFSSLLTLAIIGYTSLINSRFELGLKDKPPIDEKLEAKVPETNRTEIAANKTEQKSDDTKAN